LFLWLTVKKASQISKFNLLNLFTSQFPTPDHPSPLTIASQNTILLSKKQPVARVRHDGLAVNWQAKINSALSSIWGHIYEIFWQGKTGIENLFAASQ
jgi:hypothetical protein